MSIIFIEGLPGSGKSTFAKRLASHYETKGKNVKMYNEGDLHPIDLAWCSIIEQKTFRELLEKYSKYKDQIKNYTKMNDNQYVTAYTKVRVEDEDVSFYDDFSKYEIYKVKDLKSFQDAHIKLWSSLEEDEQLYIFECVSLQNHINELILKYNMNTIEIVAYFTTLFSSLKQKSTLFYIRQLNVEQTLKKIIEERRSDNPLYKDWIELVIEYFQNTLYGETLGYTTDNGVIQYFKDRMNIELQVLKSLPIKTHIFDLDDDYEVVFEEMKKVNFD